MQNVSHRIFPLNFDSLRPKRLFRAIGHRTVPGMLGLASVLFLTACGSSGSGFSYQNVTVTMTPLIFSIPVNGTVTFTSTTTNAPNDPEWTLLGGFGTASLGSLSGACGSTCVYTAPASPPIYPASLSSSEASGTVTLWACSPGGGLFGVCSVQTFTITAPTVTTGIIPLTAAVPLSGTAQFTAYAVGNINNAITVQVNGVTGGSTSTGTIVPTAILGPGAYLYTAPANMPMTGSTVTITVISQADPTKTQTAVVTLQ